MSEPKKHVLCSACGHMGCEHLAHELEELREAARAMLAASELGVSETEGIRRAQRLARLVGYGHDAGEKAAPIARDDVGRAASECGRLFCAVREEVDLPGSAWHAALFLFSEPPAPGAPGHVVCATTDRDKALAPIARWIMDRLEAEKGKAQA